MPWFNIELDEEFSKKFKSGVIERYGQLRGRMNMAFVEALERDMFVKDTLVKMVDRGMDKIAIGEAMATILLLYQPPKEDEG